MANTRQSRPGGLLEMTDFSTHCFLPLASLGVSLPKIKRLRFTGDAILRLLGRTADGCLVVSF